jgi:uncharacterized membrane protein HdeD (DUF308 family)
MWSIAIVVVGLVVGVVFFRKQVKKILLVVALSIAAGGALRLIEEVRKDQGIVEPLIALSGLGAIWLVAWLLNRPLSRKRTPKLSSKVRSGPPRVGLR